MLKKRLLMNITGNGIIANGGGVFGVNKHIYSAHRFSNDLVAEPITSGEGPSARSFDYIIMTKEETQLLLDAYIESPNDNQIYEFFIVNSDRSTYSKNSIFQCFIEIPLLYNNEDKVGVALDNYELGSYGYVKITKTGDVPSTNEINYKNGYSPSTFIGGIKVVFD